MIEIRLAFMNKLFKIFGIVVTSLVLFLALSVYLIFGRQQRPHTGPELGHGIEQVADGFATTFILDPQNSQLVLIDAGNDTSGQPILDALKKRGKSPVDVAAIFITHAHPDHDAAVNVFPKAEVFAMQDEVDLASGKEAYGSPLHKYIGPFNPHPFKVTHPLQDGEKVQIGNLNITAYEVSGHTPGSAAYLAQGVLFTGDAFGITADLKVDGPVRIFSRSVPKALDSLRLLLSKIATRTSEIEFIATSHNGTMLGSQGLLQLNNFLIQEAPHSKTIN
jgi:hydroxyacylglutathione hydrolase